jgi:hypothetical protein
MKSLHRNRVEHPVKINGGTRGGRRWDGWAAVFIDIY